MGNDKAAPQSTGARPALSAVVVTYDQRELLRECLVSLAAQSVPGGLEVLVVDNGSRDGTAELVRREFPEVRLLEPGRNLGFAAGNNLGLRTAAARRLVLVNNDVVARPGALARLLAAAEADPAVGAVTGKLVFADRPGVIQNAGVLLLSDGGGGDRGAGEPDDGRYDDRVEVFGFCGAAALLKREMLEDVGLFDASFFMYYEDTDLSWRMRLRGWKVVYEPEAVFLHRHAASSVERSEFFTFHADRNRLLMLLRNAPAGFLLEAARGVARRAAGSPATAGAHPRPDVRRRVLLSLLGRLPATLVKRVATRSRRTAPDAGWKALVYPRDQWDRRSP